MNITLYLPDELARKVRAAKKQGLIERGFLSQTLQKVVEEKLEQLEKERKSITEIWISV